MAPTHTRPVPAGEDLWTTLLDQAWRLNTEAVLHRELRKSRALFGSPESLSAPTAAFVPGGFFASASVVPTPDALADAIAVQTPGPLNPRTFTGHPATKKPREQAPGDVVPSAWIDLGLEQTTSGSLRDMLKLLEDGVRPARTSDVARHDARERSLWHEMLIFVRRLVEAVPHRVVFSRGKRLFCDALRAAIRSQRRSRSRRRRPGGLIASAAAANMPLATEIMRHGPPLAPDRSPPEAS